ELEIRRRRSLHRSKRRGGRDAVVRRVDLDRLELPDVVVQLLRPSETRRIERAVPVRIRKAGGAQEDHRATVGSGQTFISAPQLSPMHARRTLLATNPRP